MPKGHPSRAASKSRVNASYRTACPVIVICMQEAAAELPSKRSVISRIADKTTGPESVGVTTPQIGPQNNTLAGCAQERTDAQ
jgi:hypothetical protein